MVNVNISTHVHAVVFLFRGNCPYWQRQISIKWNKLMKYKFNLTVKLHRLKELSGSRNNGRVNDTIVQNVAESC